jgi:CheY-like chemotaxis protein/anti-sigma regulatory factor (Ser/Thr protein kinase)
LRSFYRSADKGSFEPVDMNELVADVITLTKSKWKEEMGAKGIDVKVHAELQRIKPAYGNRTELREIFTNLVLNAVDSLDEDGSITISTATRDGMVVLTVADTGSGMSRETKEHCFEPFYSTKGDEGTGLGLSMVHGIVKRHSGTIDVQSERGRGTTFSISLPMATGETLKRRKPTTPAAAVSPKRILAVDDDVRSRRLLKRILAAEQHSIETASSGREALARVRNADFDLVITDRSMPDMRGDEVAKEVKTLCPEMPVILLTGFGEAMRDKREMPDGVDRVISKPVTQEDMRTVIAEIFAEKPFEQPGVCA